MLLQSPCPGTTKISSTTLPNKLSSTTNLTNTNPPSPPRPRPARKRPYPPVPKRKKTSPSPSPSPLMDPLPIVDRIPTGGVLPGGINPAPADAALVAQAVALLSVNNSFKYYTLGDGPYTLISTDDSAEQVVAGLRYLLTLTLSSPTAGPRAVHVELLSQPWMTPSLTITAACCVTSFVPESDSNKLVGTCT